MRANADTRVAISALHCRTESACRSELRRHNGCFRRGCVSITLITALLASEVLAAPLSNNLVIGGVNDAGQVVFPITEPDGGSSHTLTLSFMATYSASLDALSVVDNAGGVFSVVGSAPQTFTRSGSTMVTVSFMPKQPGPFSGRLVVDWSGFERDDSVILCGESSFMPDGGLTQSCATPPRAPARPANSNPTTQGCSTGASGLALLAVIALLRRFSSSGSS